MLAEFIALTDASKEVEWLRDLLIDIPLWTKPTPTMMIYCDSKPTLYKVASKTYNGKK